MSKLRIAFVWTNGVRNKDRFNRWNDGLRAAMKIIEQTHEVTYHEPDEDLPAVDWVLFWEAPCTHNSQENGASYRKMLKNPQKTALLFAGGPIKMEWIEGFDHIFWESECNGEEFEALGVSHSCAFGVNTDVFFPISLEKSPKEFDTVTHGTCASWKRQWLVGEAIGEKALVFGQPQDSDPKPFDLCREYGATVLLEQSYRKTNKLINSAMVSVNCADEWGGGQRQTLEAMACGVPPVVMNDSPKNKEYVIDSGLGMICNPDRQAIHNAVAESKKWQKQQRKELRAYVLGKWSNIHYAQALLSVIEKDYE